MKSDPYTKFILTVIASCLVYMVAKDISVVRVAHAQSGGTVDVNIAKVAGVSINAASNNMVTDGFLPVKIKN